MSEPSPETDQTTRWVKASSEFGSAWPHGCCRAFVDGTICGYPRREDGTCEDGHPAQSADAPTHLVSDLRAADRHGPLCSDCHLSVPPGGTT